MAFHHLALATRDAAAVYTFYTEAMGFELVKTEVGATPPAAGRSTSSSRPGAAS